MEGPLGAERGETFPLGYIPTEPFVFQWNKFLPKQRGSNRRSSGNSIRPPGEVLMAASILCLVDHTTLGAAYRPALGLGDLKWSTGSSAILIVVVFTWAVCEGASIQTGFQVPGPWLCHFLLPL